MSSSAIIIGASSKIAQAIIQQLAKDPDLVQIIAISRTQQDFQSPVTSLTCDYQEANIAALCRDLTLTAPLSRVIICNGVLHDEHKQPERRIEDINQSALTEILHSNTVIPTLWLTHLTPHLKSDTPCKVALFSARIGSISDNQLGGWYSYRASKAALNMLVQTFSIELARRAKNVKLLAFHPGTTDTPLSKPFQRSVPEGKLFTPEFVASQLLALLNNLEIDGTASYMDWNHQPIQW
ncbi:SDR family NAD(P)-dependent oxidoreductase [Rhodanobacter aciditrophus]|uniref:SDR family NAD(P)-dependent oxidoreductase n=1 Tax=Rhodanobacter aciditrophus TaxID=1623218 RepID=A0ABW4AVT9_9GAMM